MLPTLLVLLLTHSLYPMVHLSPVSTPTSLHPHTRDVGWLIGAVSRRFPGIPPPPLCFRFAAAAAANWLASPDFVYARHFTH